MRARERKRKYRRYGKQQRKKQKNDYSNYTNIYGVNKRVIIILKSLKRSLLQLKQQPGLKR